MNFIRASVFSVAVCVGCTGSDGTGDLSAEDANADTVVATDTSSDVPVIDTAVGDSAVSETGGDGTAADTTAADSKTEAAVDAADAATDSSVVDSGKPDVGVDSAPADSGADTKVADSGSDTGVVDSGSDVAVDAGPCNGPEDCAGGFCCEDVKLGGTFPACTVSAGTPGCRKTCVTTITLSCPSTATVRLCHTAANCAEAAYPLCCEYPTGGGGTKTACVNSTAASIATRCFP